MFAKRVGGGFGGKQELLTEDLVALAVLKTGKPVAYEFSRSDQFTIAPSRHPMRVSVRAGADADGTLTALAIDVLSDAGAYGNHSIGVMFHGCAESMAVYRAATKRVDAEAVYTNNVPSGAFRGYGLGQIIFAVESAMDQLADRLGMDPSSFGGATSSFPETILSTGTSRTVISSSAATGWTSASTSSTVHCQADAERLHRLGRVGGSVGAWQLP